MDKQQIESLLKSNIVCTTIETGEQKYWLSLFVTSNSANFINEAKLIRESISETDWSLYPYNPHQMEDTKKEVENLMRSIAYILKYSRSVGQLVTILMDNCF